MTRQPGPHVRHLSRAALSSLAVVLAVGSLQLAAATPAAAAPGPVQQPTTAVVTADNLPNAQIGNGVVLAQVVAGSTVFAAGEFSTARPAGVAVGGAGEVARSNILAFGITTGELTSFAPKVNGRIKSMALSADGKTLYIGGLFTKVGTVTRNHAAAFTVASGALTGFDPDVNGTVEAITTIGTTVYLGGAFNAVHSVSRGHLAAVSGSTGALLGWAPQASDPGDSTVSVSVHALAATPDHTRVIAGGNFTQLGSTPAVGMGALNASTGAAELWQVNTVVQNYGKTSAIYSLTADRDTVYGSGYTLGAPGNFEGVFAAVPSTGAVKWLQDCHGDTYSVAPVGSVVYSAGHPHYCSNIGGFPDSNPRSSQRALAVTKAVTGTVARNGEAGSAYGNFEGQPAPSLYNWFPDLNVGTYTGESQSAWAVAATSSYVVLGGEFTKVNLKAQQGLVRMAIPSLAPNKQGPKAPATDMVPTPTPQQSSVAVSWKANWDRDDDVLTYDVLRNGAVVKTFKAISQFWNRPTLTWSDLNGRPGVSYAYSVRVRDAHGNGVTSAPVSAVYPSDASYAQRMRTDGATHQWRLGSPSGSTSDPDTVGSLPLAAPSGVIFGVPGALPADADTAATFSAAAQTATTAPLDADVSVEGWFRTTSSGALVGFGSTNRSGASTAGDRQVYLTTAGKLAFAEHPTGAAAPVTITSTASYNDNVWHQLVAVHAGTRVDLYVDGSLVAGSASAATMPATGGAWTLGGATPSDLPSHPTVVYRGSLDDVSVFASPLSARQVRDHYLAGQPKLTVTGVNSGRR